jgi:formylglycine-generating enzyme required for sulfatase activity
VRGALAIAGIAVAAGCTLNPNLNTACVTNGDCIGGRVCVDRQCVSPGLDAGGADAIEDAGGTGGTGDGGTPRPPPGGWDASTAVGCSGWAEPVPVNIDKLFCIDSTLVTYGQYTAFLTAAAATPPAQLPDCIRNETFNPAAGLPPAGTADDYPVTGVDFCDARAYCTWAGKRLCHGLAPHSEFDIGAPQDGEAFYACSGGAMNLAYAYGLSYSQSACETPSATPTSVGSLQGCVSAAYLGLYDLSGNIGFWEEMCDDMFCRDNPPPSNSGSNAYRCDVENHDSRAVQVANLGIRCCSDVTP